MGKRTAYWRDYHQRNRDRRLAQMAARYTPRPRRPPQGQTARDDKRRAREKAYRMRWQVERKLCKHLDITMAEARKITGTRALSQKETCG